MLTLLDRLVVFDRHALDSARKKIKENSLFTVMIGRSIPGLMVPISVVAGTIQMPAGKFLLGVVLTLSVWIAAFIGVGGSLGHFGSRIEFPTHSLWYSLIVLIAFIILAAAANVWKRIRRTKSGEEPSLLRDKSGISNQVGTDEQPR